MLSQQAMLFPHMSVAANVAYAPRCKGQSRSAARATAQRWLEAVDATDLADRRPAQLSGGQAQRVAVARALAAEPQAAAARRTDVGARRRPRPRRCAGYCARSSAKTDRTAIIVTHDLLDALAIADKVIVVEHGRVVEERSGPQRSDCAPQRLRRPNRGHQPDPGSRSPNRGCSRHLGAPTSQGSGHVEPGAAAIALFRPSAVAVHLEPPHASPRNVIAVTIAELDIHGTTVRIRGIEQPDGSTGLAADITAASAADLDLEPGQTRVLRGQSPRGANYIQRCRHRPEPPLQPVFATSRSQLLETELTAGPTSGL